MSAPPLEAFDVRAMVSSVLQMSDRAARVRDRRDLSGLDCLYLGQAADGWRWAVARDRRDGSLRVVMNGIVAAAWWLYPEASEGDVEMLVGVAAHALSHGATGVGSHRRFGASDSLGYPEFKVLVEYSEHRGDLISWDHSGSGGPPWKHWGPPDPIRDAAAAAAYLAASRGWVERLFADDTGLRLDPCPLEILRPIAVAGPDGAISEVRERYWDRYEKDVCDLRERHRDAAAAFAETVGRPDLAYWCRHGRPPPPEPRPMRECMSAYMTLSELGFCEWVYVLRERDGDRVKIGRTDVPDPRHRIRAHQTSSSQGRHLDVVAVLLGTSGLENDIHNRFARDRVPGKTEWYLSRGAVASAVRKAFVDVHESAYVFTPDETAPRSGR